MSNTKTAENKDNFRSLLQSIVCDRYASLDAALAAIDDAHIAGNITELERRQLSAKAHGH